METKLIIKGDGSEGIALLRAFKEELKGVDKSIVASAKANAKLSNENKKLEQSVKKSNTQLKNKEDQLKKAKQQTDKLKNSLSELKAENASANSSTASLANTMKQLRNIMLGVAAVRFAAGIANQINEIGDAAVNINAKLTNATGSVKGINNVFDELKRQSRLVGTSIETNVDLFQRLTRATKELGTPQSQILQLTENINSAFVVSGASAQETRNAIIQLAQGFSAGALRGDEFRAVMEQAPALIDSLKESLNVTQGELIDMAFAGELTSEKLVTAFTDMGDGIREQVKNIPLTTERAFENLRTSFIETARQGGVAADFNKVYAESVQLIADNLNGILSVAISSIATGGMVLLVKSLAAASEWFQTAGNSAKFFSNTLKTIGFGVVVAGISFLIERSREWRAELEEIERAASEIPSELQKSHDILSDISELSALGDIANATDLANQRLSEFTNGASEVRVQIAGVKGEIEQLRATNEAFLRDPNAFTNFSANLLEIDKLEAQLRGLEEQLRATNVAGGEFIDSALGNGADLTQGNAILEYMYNVINAERERIENLKEQARAQQEAEAARVRANESIEKQIESMMKSNHQLLLEKTRLTEGVAAYQQLAIAKIASLNVDKKLKSELITLTKEQFRLKNAIAASKQETKEAQEQEASMNKTRQIASNLVKEFGNTQARISAIFSEQAEKLRELREAGLDTPETIEALNNETEQLLENVTDLGDAVKEIDFEKAFEGFAASLNPINSQLQQFKEELKVIDGLTKSGKFSAGEQAFFKTGLAAEFALNSMADMAEEGSSAQQKLQAAAAITNGILGIKAILTQGEGDPYTAFARMASMAALVASLGVQVAGAFGGSGGGGAERQQEIQGTGTVLGDSGAKSESISNALDLIAEASEKIVGINSKMLRSLNTMNSAISGTVTEIAKLGEIGDLGTRAGSSGGLLGGLLGGIGLSSLFGGSKIKDRGVQILAGSIGDAINGDLFQAYEVAKRRGLFGSSTRTNTAALEDGITNQISLIFQSMNEAILSGAEALGLDMAEVENALNSYRIEEQRISLLDLSPDEQQAELEAVFSSIFDNLTELSIPFITQFQQAGEGLGETLARVSTTVLVFEEAIDSMGLDFIAKQIDPELFAQAAVSISDFAGGIDEFIDGYTNYVSKFLSESEQMALMTERIGGVFSDLGLQLPQTRDGFKELISGLDLTTQSGQEAFGTLISLSSEIDSYYTGLEGQRSEFQELVDSFMDSFFGGVEGLRVSTTEQLTEIQSSLVGLGLSATTTMDQFGTAFLNALPDLTPSQVAQWVRVGNALNAATQAAESFSAALLSQARSALALRNSLRASALELFGAGDSLASINDQIALLESGTNSVFDATSGGINNVAAAGENLFQSWQDALFSMERFLDNLLIDPSVSPLSPQEQLNTALSQFDELVALAEGGDLDAYNELQGLISQILSLNNSVNASGQDNRDIFEYVTAIAAGIQAPEGLVEITPVVVTEPIDINPISLEVSEELQALYDRRDEIEQNNFEAQIFEFADTIRQYMNLTRLSLDEVMADLGVTAEDLFDGLNINFDDLDEEMRASLATLANVLGIEFGELTSQVGISAGVISDSNSLLNDALGEAITRLPQEFQDELTPLFEDLENATSPEAQEAALQALLESVGALPVEWRDQLAPFFDDIDVTTESGQQLVLLEAQNDILSNIATALQEGITIGELLNPQDFGSGGTIEDPTVVVVPDPIDATPPGGIGPDGNDTHPVPSAHQLGDLINKTTQLISKMDDVGDNTGGTTAATNVVANKIDTLIEAFTALANELRN